MTPDSLTLMRTLLAGIVTTPGAVFLGLAAGWLVGWSPSERFVARLTALTYGLSALAVTVLASLMHTTGQVSLLAPLGTWFRVGEYEFPLTLFVDRLSLPLVALTVLLAGLVGSFSVRYLHRERGYLCFFLLLHLFAFGVLVVFAAGSLDLLVGGWELVGITSVLLIAFFHERPEPVASALRVFATYRTCDLGLLLGVFTLHHLLGSASCWTLLHGEWPAQRTMLDAGSATAVGLLFLWAAAGKAAQVPFSGWLPRAMEGPTPSSAIFYGALSVHAGPYLLLRMEPVLLASPWAAGAVVLVGALTAVHGTLAGRAATDVKTSLAYASLTQLGIIFVETGLGWSWLALLHVCGHAIVRTLQFLRAPSMLHDFHRMHSAVGGQLAPTGAHYEALLPEPLRTWLYRMALDRGHLDTVLDRYAISPVVRLSTWLAALEQGWAVGRPVPRPVPAVSAREIAGGIDG